jgi:hypothetical protein
MHDDGAERVDDGMQENSVAGEGAKNEEGSGSPLPSVVGECANDEEAAASVKATVSTGDADGTDTGKRIGAEVVVAAAEVMTAPAAEVESRDRETRAISRGWRWDGGQRRSPYPQHEGRRDKAEWKEITDLGSDGGDVGVGKTGSPPPPPTLPFAVPFIPLGWFSILDDWIRECAYFIDRGVCIN